ncbi:hypothetical protein FA10DRAFT_7738 [Acaromyces ingoldii]|uniref:CENP-V/GFA domain-containing protein n=1 Tax=Acaromyces ingoldii TaxID=215250 RepID=A0A316YU93_9BASI|nr:hypothetical protein FA10DRAFT_7738 [Acaromyces ingoldii]PWN92839.1 hypothetical protein FA10DRAFT_7738 [Acaromyces ingoldii]
MSSFKGGCLCGSVTYEYNGPPGDGIACHCTHCRRYTGGVASFNLGVEAAKMQWKTKDTLTAFVDKCDIGEGPRRWFCNKCGSPLATTLDYDPAPMFIKAGSIDDFESVFPDVKVHLFTPEVSTAVKKHWNFDGQTLFKGMPGSEQVAL